MIKLQLVKVLNENKSFNLQTNHGRAGSSTKVNNIMYMISEFATLIHFIHLLLYRPANSVVDNQLLIFAPDPTTTTT